MSDRAALLEAALDSLPEGIVLEGMEGEVCFWNRAAEAITGYAGGEVMGRHLPEPLAMLLKEDAPLETGHGTLVRVKHRMGHDVPAVVHLLALCDAMGEPMGAAAIFHPAESLDALPHGAENEDSGGEGHEDLEERLAAEFDEASREGLPFGLLWIAVDQGQALRRTHGANACDAMLIKVERALRQGLRPGEELRRWGDEEFLVMAHERNAGMLATHARTLAGLARTADFRWWGDRISITVSIGAAQVEPGRGETPAELLQRAREAMVVSVHAGGNRVTPMPGSETCLPL
jgi:diguanylate cyclase (GGDEF)-like protein/PAS domain S-box-containing protein